VKILFLSQYFFPEQFLNNTIARSLVDAGHKVTAVTCVPNYPAGRMFDGYSNRRRTRENWHGVDIHRVLTVPRGKSRVELLLNYLVYPVAAAWRILRLGRAGCGDVSFVSMPSPLLQALAGIFAKKVWRVPAVYWVQDIWPESAIITLKIRNRMVIAALEAICGWIYRQADLILVQSDGFHGAIARCGVHSGRIATLPNCAPELFESAVDPVVPDRIRQLIPTGRRILMFAGNIGDSQDFETIVAAAERLDERTDLAIVVVGSGRGEARARALVAERGLADRIVFLGRFPESDMPAFLACADAALVSLRDEAIFALTIPSKVQAYLACGRPVLASLSGEGASVIARAKAGLVVAPSDPESLSEAMTRLSQLTDDQLSAMGEAGRRYYRKCFSLNAVIGRLEDFLQMAVDQRRELAVEISRTVSQDINHERDAL
jgi:colanic acid biosynthesis glycosyl transferase WcaI